MRHWTFCRFTVVSILRIFYYKIGEPFYYLIVSLIPSFQLEETQLAVRLEPLTWHVARALVDFSQAYNWNVIIVLFNVHSPGSLPLLTELKFLQDERGKQDHPNFYE